MMPNLVTLTATFLIYLLHFTPLVSAHGYVQELSLGKVKYLGWNPNVDNTSNPPPSQIIRKVPGIGPVLDVTSIDIQCNGSPTAPTAPAALVGEIPAGSHVRFNWTTWPADHAGPILTYLARVPTGVDVKKWVPGKEAVWFKIDHRGKNYAGNWAAADLLTASSGIYSVLIPAQLAAGEYLLRHEIIDLHNAKTYPGAQFFPVCAQIKVTGSGKFNPIGKLVSFPGAYTPTSPGIVWDTASSASYPLPGPSLDDVVFV